MSIFKLPDLGEGLKEAEIREWHVRVGETVRAAQPLVAVETAKAVVEVPSPQAGVITRLFGDPGDTMTVGKPLVEFGGNAATPSPSATDKSAATPPPVEKTPWSITAPDAEVPSNLRVTPPVRGLAQRLGVNLDVVTPTGPDGTITAEDVQRVYRVLGEAGPLERLRGVRKAMAVSMAQSRDEVMPATITDDATLAAWNGTHDLTARLIRGLVAGCKAEPALNAWYDSEQIGRRVLKPIHVGIGIDRPEGLFVAVLRDVEGRSLDELRQRLDRMKAAVRDRSIAAEDLRGYTITLSNFGRFGGRYATPVILPPTVAIIAAGTVRDGVVAIDGQPAVAKVLPLSVTFDHRCVTGGEAARFLAAMIADLQLDR